MLNAIAVNEAKADRLLTAWADTTDDAELERVLRFVAVREREHAWAFTKRLSELGCAVDEAGAGDAFGDFDALLALVRSERGDADKIAELDRADSADPFARLFDDETIDPETGALLGRFIAEERDSVRRLRAQYERIRAPGGEGTEIAELKASLAEVKAVLAKLQQMTA